jgi:hypothetical protein
MRGLVCLGGRRGGGVAHRLVSIAKNRPDRRFALLAHIPDLVDDVIQVVPGIRDDRAFVVPSVSVEGHGTFTNPLPTKGIDVFSVLNKVQSEKEADLLKASAVTHA